MHPGIVPAAENRVEGRSNVFLTATLHVDGKTAPVRIRNISARGALIDAPGLPEVGSPVKLVRGGLSAVGEIAWVGEGQAGVNFDREIDVPAWVQRVGHPGQQRVDGMIAALRAGMGAVPERPRRHSLAAISAELDAICERMAHAQPMSDTLSEDLVRLDTVAQALRALAAGEARG